MPDRMRDVKSDSPEQESADDALKRIVDGFQHFRR
ncbi:TPA: carbonic anhydrase, partial [Pseudomonas aeruginosa]|nr:carbonic anhydrase [Pseudomonas aeruginosa]